MINRNFCATKLSIMLDENEEIEFDDIPIITELGWSTDEKIPVTFEGSIQCDSANIEALTRLFDNKETLDNNYTLHLDPGKLVPARHHKKKRIQKKWIKRYGYKRVPSGNPLVMSNFSVTNNRDGTYTLNSSAPIYQ